MKVITVYKGKIKTFTVKNKFLGYRLAIQAHQLLKANCSTFKAL